MIIEVGKKFPLEAYKSSPEGAIIMTNNGCFDILIKIGGITAAEEKAFRMGYFKVGVYVVDAIPFILLDFPTAQMTLDAPFNFLKVYESSRAEWLSAEANAVSIISIEAKNYIVKSQRLVGFPIEMIQKVKAAAELQTKVYSSSRAVDITISVVLGRMSTDAMIAKTKMFTFKDR